MNLVTEFCLITLVLLLIMGLSCGGPPPDVALPHKFLDGRDQVSHLKLLKAAPKGGLAFLEQTVFIPVWLGTSPESQSRFELE